MPSTEVHLAIYDLSRGMARTLSTQFLGPNHAIDIIPHTGIIAFGKEYLFGSMGIDFMDPSDFRRSHQIFPIEVQSLGHTQKSQDEFEDWCTRVTISGLYDGGNYNLFTRNCNNFSHDAAVQGLGLSRGVPVWILETPTRFLSSPLGQMITPMLQQMQISGPQTGQNNHQRWRNPSSSHSSFRVENSSTQFNPWMNHDIKDSFQEEKKQKNKTLSTPILDSHNCTLLSTDKTSVVSCINKLLDSKASEPTAVSILSQLRNDLTEVESMVSDESLENGIHLLISILQHGKKSDALHSLIILRILVVHINDSQISNHVLSSLCETLNTDDSPITTNSSTLSMIWCVISNLMGSLRSVRVDSETLNELMDRAIDTLNSKNHGVQVRQMVSAFLYNTAHYLTIIHTDTSVSNGDDYCLDDNLVSILCGIMDSFAQEQDSLTKLRRLMVVGKLLRPKTEETDFMKRHFELVQNLLRDLGFLDILVSLSKHDDVDEKRSELETKISEFSTELVNLIAPVE